MPPPEISNQNQFLMSLDGSLPVRFEMVEIQITEQNMNGNTVSMPTNEYIQGRRILYVDAYNVQTYSVSPMGRPVIALALFLRSTLTLYQSEMSRQNIRKVPFNALNPFFVPGGTAPSVQQRMLLNNDTTDWNKCEINTGSPITNTFLGQSFLLGVWFVDK